MPGKRSMSQNYLLSLVTMATLPVVLLGYLWVSDQHRQFEEQSGSWRDTYIDAQQQALRRRVAEVIDNLDFERGAIDGRQRTALRLAVDNGVAQLDGLLRQERMPLDRARMLQRAHDLLGPIRFGGGHDHYFIQAADGTAVLLPAYPQREGGHVENFTDAAGTRVAERIAQLAQQNGDAYLDIWYRKPGDDRGTYLTRQYVRYYAPLNIYIGAVGYVDDMMATVQREELERLAAVPDDIVLTIGDQNGQLLFDSYEPQRRGRPLPLKDALGDDIEAQIRLQLRNPEGGFLQMQRLRHDSGRAVPMVMYVREYAGWRWRIGAAYFLDKLDATIAQQRTELQARINHRIAFGALALLFLLLAAVIIAHRLALRTRRALHSFTEFFSAASRHSTSIDVAQLPYVEFEQLAQDANRMIEQRGRIEHALRLSEQRFEMALNAAGSHLWDMDLRDGVIFVAGSLFRQLGCGSEARYIGPAEWREWVHPDDLQGIQRVHEQMAGSPGNYGIELRLRAADGTYRWFLSGGGAVEFDRAGRPVRALGTMVEISARKQMEQELVAARIAAEDANHAKSQFLSSISHELRTPLNGVLGYAQILLRDQSTSAEQRHNLRAIESCGQHLLTLIDDVLDLAKIESGKIEIHDSPCDLYDLLESVSNILRERVDSKGLIYSLEIDAAVPANVVVDEVKLRQILVNLLGNAVKFTDEGAVTLQVTLRGDSELLFRVWDTGIGIAQEKQEEIFHPFQQLGGSGGTGLGLPISLRLCEAMQGGLSLQSAPGAGSCFSFYLPLRRSAAPRLVRSQPGSYQLIDTGSRSITVMVVDDNPINRQVLSGMLRASGIDVVEAEHGQDALDKLRARPLPLVLMDVRMPVMDGFAATGAIKRDPLLRDTVVIAVSASVFPDVVARMRAQGCDDFVGKPVRVAELLAKVAHYLQLPLRAQEPQPLVMATPPATRLPDQVAVDLRGAVTLGDVEAMRAVVRPLYERTPELAALAQHIERLLDSMDIEAVRALAMPNAAVA